MQAVLEVGMLQLTIIALGLPILNLLILYRSALEGVGRPFIPVLSGFMEMILRLAAVFLTPLVGQWGVLLSDVAGWIGAGALLAVGYYVIANKKGEHE